MDKKINGDPPSGQKAVLKKVGDLIKNKHFLLAAFAILLILIVLLTIVIVLLPSPGKKGTVAGKPTIKEKPITISSKEQYEEYVRIHSNSAPVYKGPMIPPAPKFLIPTPTSKPTNTPTGKPTPTPTIVPLPKGPQIYSVSSKSGITVKQLWISNLDTKIGDSQEMKLTIQDPSSAVNSVTINLITDHKKELHTLSLISGSGKDGVWDGSWKTDDTHDITYQAQITIKDQAGGSFSFTPSFR